MRSFTYNLQHLVLLYSNHCIFYMRVILASEETTRQPPKIEVSCVGLSFPFVVSFDLCFVLLSDLFSPLPRANTLPGLVLQ